MVNVEDNLECFAEKDLKSKRRKFTEDREFDIRDDFARDRDRIIHSRSFRRLKGKTQVFIATNIDHHRTRLTHTLEVAQIARSIARYLKVNEDLTEAIALSHDLGHPPYGHAGENALNDCVKDYGGFDHNEHSFHIVSNLEERYPEFNGLNLTWACLEGIVKHNGPFVSRETMERFETKFSEYNLNLNTHASFEAQVAAIADDVAYNHHDIDDGYRAGLITIEDLKTIPYVEEFIVNIKKKYPTIDDSRLLTEVIRQMLSCMVKDIIKTTEKNLERLKPKSSDDIRNAGEQIVSMSEDMNHHTQEIKSFLYKNVYRSNSVNLDIFKVNEKIKVLFVETMKNSEYKDLSEDIRAKKVIDYIASMTDSYANNEYEKLSRGKK